MNEKSLIGKVIRAISPNFTVYLKIYDVKQIENNDIWVRGVLLRKGNNSEWFSFEKNYGTHIETGEFNIVTDEEYLEQVNKCKNDV